MTDTEDGSWVSDKAVEPPVTLTLNADQPVYDNGVLKVNVSWSAGQSDLFTFITAAAYLVQTVVKLAYVVSLNFICQRKMQFKIRRGEWSGGDGKG